MIKRRQGVFTGQSQKNGPAGQEHHSPKVYPGRYSEFMANMATKDVEPESSAERLRLEYRMALIISELAGLDRRQNQPEYQDLETEYLEIARKLRFLTV